MSVCVCLNLSNFVGLCVRVFVYVNACVCLLACLLRRGECMLVFMFFFAFVLGNVCEYLVVFVCVSVHMFVCVSVW